MEGRFVRILLLVVVLVSMAATMALATDWVPNANDYDYADEASTTLGTVWDSVKSIVPSALALFGVMFGLTRIPWALKKFGKG